MCKPAWKRPSLAAVRLEGDERLVLDALRGGLRCAEARGAQFERARQDYEQSTFTASRELVDAAEEKMGLLIEEVYAWRGHGCPRAWEPLGPFYYYLALLQQGR